MAQKWSKLTSVEITSFSTTHTLREIILGDLEVQNVPLDHILML